MGYVVGHSKSNVSNTRRRGNVTIGVDANGYDKTSVSGLYAGVSPVPGKHNIVRTFEGADPDFYSLSNAELINFVNGLGERNLTTTTPSQGGWNGGYSLIDSDTRTFRFTTQQNNSATTSAWRTWYWDVSDYVGQTVAISADVEFISETNCAWRDIHIGQGNTGQFTIHIAGSDAADKVKLGVKPTTPVKMQWSGSINATGIVGFTQWIHNVTADGANAVVEVSNLQIEANNHVTEFSNPDRTVSSVTEARDYLSRRNDTFFFDDIPDDTPTSGLILELDASNPSNFIDNEPTENLIAQMVGTTSISYPEVVYRCTVLESNVVDATAPGGQYSRFTGIDSSSNNQLYSRFPQSGIDVRNQTITYSVYLKGSGTCHLTVYADNASYGTSSTITLTDTWTRYTYTRAVTNYTSNCWVAVRGVLNTTDVYIASQQAELKTYATPFTTGSRSQNTTWYDLSGNGAHAEAVNMPTYNSKGYFTFSGDDEFHSVDISQEYRDLILILRTTKASGLHMVFGHHDNADDSLRFEGPNIRTTSNIDANDWHYGSVSDVFIDGVFDAVSGSNVPLNDKFHFLRAYRSNNSGFGSSFRYEISSAFLSNRYFEGDLAYIASYNRKLSEEEVLQLYYGGNIVTDSLLLAVDAGNLVSYESGSTTTYSMTGSLSGSLVNGVGFLNQNGGVWELDGSNDYIQIPDNGTLDIGTGDYTIGVWIYFPSGQGNHSYVHLFAFDAQSNFALKAGDYQYGPRDIYFYGGNNYRSYTDDFGHWAIEEDVWQYIVLTRNGSTHKAYYNGQYVGSITETAKSLSVNNVNIGIDGSTSEYTRQYRGPIHFYNKELSADEVLQNYNAQKARFL